MPWISPYSCSRSSLENSQNSLPSFPASPPLSLQNVLLLVAAPYSPMPPLKKIPFPQKSFLFISPIFPRKPSATPLFTAQQPQKLQPPPWRGSPALSRAPCGCSSKKPGPPFKCHPPGASQVAGRLNIIAYIYI